MEGIRKKTIFTRFLFSAGREGFEPSAEFNPGTHLAGEPNRPLWHLPSLVGLGGGRGIRTHGEPFDPHLFSRQAPSATRPSLRMLNNPEVKILTQFH